MMFLLLIPVQLIADKQYQNQLEKHENKSEFNVELFSLTWCFQTEKTDVYQLKHENCVNWKWHNSPENQAKASELRIINETQVVLVHTVLENEEYSGNHGQVRHDGAE